MLRISCRCTSDVRDVAPKAIKRTTRWPMHGWWACSCASSAGLVLYPSSRSSFNVYCVLQSKSDDLATGLKWRRQSFKQRQLQWRRTPPWEQAYALYKRQCRRYQIGTTKPEDSQIYATDLGRLRHFIFDLSRSISSMGLDAFPLIDFYYGACAIAAQLSAALKKVKG